MLARALFLVPLALFALTPGSARADDDVFVHVASKAVVRLEHRTTPNASWEIGCNSPCDAKLPRDGEYRIVFTPIGPPGDPFALDKDASEVNLKVDMPSTGMRVAGHIMTGVGIAAAVIGVVGAVSFGIMAARSPNEAACHDGEYNDGRDGGPTCGLGEAIATVLTVFSGAVALAGGGLILGGVALTSDGEGSAKQVLNPRLDAFVRHPSWVAPSLDTTSRPATFVPLSFAF